ncbi:MAG TPA: ATP-binding cassette domain-containing protein [Rhodothermales bacterium]|nr:ATP-binding cassette domain-containing protein [Rhodothermales bacterium]
MILQDISFSLHRGDLLAILGRSGSGKTTLLKCLAGLEPPDSGQIVVDGQDVRRLKPQVRGMVYLYQEPLLFPHLNVFENVAFGLRLKKIAEKEVKTQVNALIEQLGLADQAHKAPHQLSGGQKQRASFGRALLVKPRLLLLDEPFASLDVEIRAQMQTLFLNLAKTYHTSTLLVTHDLKEALIMGKRFGLMQNGSLKLYETPQAFIQDEQTGVLREMAFWQGQG